MNEMLNILALEPDNCPLPFLANTRTGDPDGWEPALVGKLVNKRQRATKQTLHVFGIHQRLKLKR